MLVIGAGLAGLEAAKAAAEAGARVMQVDEEGRAGGCAAWSGVAVPELATLVADTLLHKNVEFLPQTFAAGFYADRWVALIEPGRMTKVRANAIIVATGQGTLAITELQSEGRRPMAARDFLAGHPVQPGARFGSSSPTLGSGGP